MNSDKPGPRPESRPDDLIRSNTVELTEEELGSVNGGIKIGSKLASLLHKTETVDQTLHHEIHIEILKPH